MNRIRFDDNSDDLQAAVNTSRSRGGWWGGRLPNEPSSFNTIKHTLPAEVNFILLIKQLKHVNYRPYT